MVLAPSSLAVFKGPIVSPWVSKVKDGCSTWVAAVGRPAYALGRVEAETSKSPRCLIFPALEKMRILIHELREKQPLT
jgi:hypothetical protein